MGVPSPRAMACVLVLAVATVAPLRIADAAPPPPAPTGVTAVAVTANQINVSWTKVAGIPAYRILRSLTSGGPYAPVGMSSAASFSNSGLTAGKTYYYVVQCYNGTFSPNSAEVSATTGTTSPPPGSPPNAPTNLAATGSGGQVTLTWTMATGAAAYRYDVRRGTTSGGTVAIDAVGGTVTSYVDNAAPASGVYYTVVAVGQYGSSPPSNEVFVPGSLSLSVTGTNDVQASLSWTAAPGATSYRVLRGSTSGSATLLQTVGTTPTTFTDSGLSASTTYYYVVEAVAGGTPRRSNEVAATTTPVQPPTNVVATGVSSSEIEVTWTPPGALSPDANGYVVYYGTTDPPSSTLVVSGANPSFPVRLQGLSSSTTYHVQVQTTTAANGSSVKTPATTAATLAPPQPWQVVQSVPGVHGEGVTTDPNDPDRVYVASSGEGVFRSVDGGATWTRGGAGPGRAFFYELAHDAATPGTLYALTIDGLHRSTDAAASWTPIDGGLPSEVWALAAHPTVGGTLYASAGSDGIFRSVDHGTSWTLLDPFHVGQELARIVVHGSSLYVFSYTHGVSRSLDGGATWSFINSGLPTLVAYGGARDPSGRLYAALEGEGVYTSTDGGASWVASPDLDGIPIYSLVVDPTAPSTVYGIGDFDLYRTIDGGASWTSVLTTQDYGFYGVTVSADGTLWVPASAGRVRKSTDAGFTFQDSTNDLCALSTTSIVFDAAPGILYASTQGQGVYRSTTGGATWVQASSGLGNPVVRSNLAVHPTMSGVLYAGTFGSGVFKTTDGGASWSSATAGITDPNVSALALDPAAPDTVYAGTEYGGGVFKTTDGGATWAAVNNGLPADAVVYSLVVDGSAVYAGVYALGIYKTTDGGATWTYSSSGITSNTSLRMSRAGPGHLFASDLSGEVFETTNGGASWTQVGAVPGTFVPSIAVDPLDPMVLYAVDACAASSAVFKSSDSGATWRAVSTGLPMRAALSVAPSPSSPGLVFLGGFGGIAVSTSGGE